MPRVLFTKGLADIRARKLQSILVSLIIAAAAALGVLAVSITDAASSTYEDVLDAAHGGHVWMFSDNAEALTRMASVPGVQSASGPFARTQATLTSTAQTHPLLLWAMPPGGLPTVAPTLIRDGHWLGGGADEAVIDRGLALKAGLSVGDTMTVNGGGGSRALHIVGIGTNTTRAPYPLTDPADVFTTPEVVQGVAGGHLAAYVGGVRLRDPNATDAFISSFNRQEQVFSGGITWQSIRDQIGNGDQPLVILLRTFAVFAFFAVGFVIANTVSGQVLSQYRDIGLLRAIGVTPRQVTLLLLGQQVALAIVAATIGAFVGVFVTPLLLGRISGLLDTTPGGSLDPVMIAVVVGVALSEVLLFSLLPAWRGGRLSTVQALTVGPSNPANRPSRLAAVAERAHLSPAVEVGLKDLFARPGRTWLSVAALTLAFATVASGLTIEATAKAISDDPLRIGRPPYQLELAASEPDGHGQLLTNQALLAAAFAEPGTASALTLQRLSGSLDGRQYFPVDALDGEIARMPYPIVSGRMFSGPGEAVIGLNLQRDRSLHLGDTFTLSLLRGPSITLRVVGTVASEDNNGHTVLYPLGDLASAAPEMAAAPALIAVRLRPGIDPAEAAVAIRQRSTGTVVVDNREARFRENLASRTHDMRSVTIPLTLSLMLIALINLVSTLAFAIRERVPEFGVLKAIGYTPRQIYVSVGVGSVVLAAIASAAGAPLGYLVTVGLVNHFGQQGGWPAGVAAPPPLLWVAVALPAVAILILLASAIPGRIAARMSPADALRFE